MINNKTRVVISACSAACLSQVTNAAVNFNADFINGFETGVFVRDDPKAFKDYSCEKPKSNSSLASTVKQMQAPIALMKNMITDKEMKSVATSVEMFIAGILDLENVFIGDYDGGDFCSGMVFGRSGSKILVDIARKFSSIPDEHNPALKKLPDRHERVTKSFIDKDKAKHP